MYVPVTMKTWPVRSGISAEVHVGFDGNAWTNKGHTPLNDNISSLVEIWLAVFV